MPRLSKHAIVYFLTHCVFAAPANAEWIAVETSRLTVLSEVSEKRTRAWLSDFNRFIDALGYTLTVDEELLPPLTAILFRNSRDYRRYRLQTASGAANNVGIFINDKSWSLLSLVANRGFSDVEHTTYHEAIHWYMAASPILLPVWYSEGMAEVFATYELSEEGVLWGRPIEEHVVYLRTLGLEPMERFLRSSQDRALHGSATYYAQAWAFVHFLLFGRNEGTQEQLIELLNALPEMGLTRAFESALGKSFDEVGDDLDDYIRRGQYGMFRLEFEYVERPEHEVTVSAADSERIELELGRLALGTGNIDLAMEHYRNLARLAPESASTHDLLAALAAAMEDDAALDKAIGKALRLQSTDARTYDLAARRLIVQHDRGDTNPPRDRFHPAAARQIADAIARSLEVYPYDIAGYEMLVIALLAATDLSETDSQLIAAGRRLYPNEAVLMLGEAAIAYGSEDVEDALEILSRALSESQSMSPKIRETIRYLRDTWMLEGLGNQVNVLMLERRLEEAAAILDAALSDSSLSGSVRRTIARMRANVEGYEQMDSARDAVIRGDTEAARRILESVAENGDVLPPLRTEARQWLDDLPPASSQ